MSNVLITNIYVILRIWYCIVISLVINCTFLYKRYILFRKTWETFKDFRDIKGLLWSWSYGSWIYNYLCNQCLSPWIFLIVLYSFQPKPLKTIQTLCTHIDSITFVPHIVGVYENATRPIESFMTHFLLYFITICIYCS